MTSRNGADQPARYRLGVDVGGTHTDLVLLDVRSGTVQVEKVSTTPANPALGVLNGVNNFVKRGIPPQAIEFFSHGTTITTNALLEMRGAAVGLMITRGFRAVQEVQTQARDGNPFDYFYEKPEPIVPQSLTREIPGRIDFAGREIEPLDAEAVRAAARALRSAGVHSIAVCYLFSYANPAHEQDTRRLILEEFPDADVSLSCEVLPRIREWPRLSTTLLNAYLQPVLVSYIALLNTELDRGGLHTPQRFLMQSNGGVMPFKTAVGSSKTVFTLFSGPAAGAQASAYLAAEDARKGLVTLDMGGTSCDIAFIERGAPLEVTEVTVARRPLGVPALDMTTISAGGGSVAWVDRGGFLCVGPRSAGADPGPVCYGRGGVMPTVTDADLVLGFLNPHYFLGGTQVLDKAAAAAALEISIAEPLGIGLIEAAAGIRRIVDMRMADEVRVFSAKRGVSVQDFTLLPFGGAGPVHAVEVGAEIGIDRILVPRRPGAFSALGLLCTDVVHDYVRSELRPIEQIDPSHAEAIFRELETQAAAELADEGFRPSSGIYQREADMRYTGQGYELRVSLQGIRRALTETGMRQARARFDDRHAEIHGHAARERPVEIVSYRLRVRVPVPKYLPVATTGMKIRSAPKSALKAARGIFFNSAKLTDTPLYERDRLPPCTRLRGPAIVEQFDSTTVVPPGWMATVDEFHNLILTRERNRHG